jgi:hypothetical protein
MCAAGNAEDLIAHHPTSNRANELSPLIKIIYGYATPLLERIAESRKAGAIPDVVGPVKLCATRQHRPRPYVRGQRVLGYCARASCSPGDCFRPAARCRKKAYCARPRLHRTTCREDDCRRARGSALQPCRQSQCYAPPGRLPQPEGELLAEIRQVITVQPTTAIARCTRLSGDGGAMSPIRFRSRRNTSASQADRKASGCASSLRWTAAPRGDLLGSDDRRRRHRPHPRSDDPERRTALRTGEPTAGGDRVAVRQRLAVHRRRNPPMRSDLLRCTTPIESPQFTDGIDKQFSLFGRGEPSRPVLASRAGEVKTVRRHRRQAAWS